MVIITRNVSFIFYPGFISIYGIIVTEDFRCRVSGVSPAAGQKNRQFDRKRNFGLAEFIKKRISNIEGMYSNYFIKRLSAAKPSFVILRLDIRYSAVRCLNPAIEMGRLIIKEPCHLTVVAYV